MSALAVLRKGGRVRPRSLKPGRSRSARNLPFLGPAVGDCLVGGGRRFARRPVERAARAIRVTSAIFRCEPAPVLGPAGQGWRASSRRGSRHWLSSNRPGRPLWRPGEAPASWPEQFPPAIQGPSGQAAQFMNVSVPPSAEERVCRRSADQLLAPCLRLADDEATGLSSGAARRWRAPTASEERKVDWPTELGVAAPLPTNWRRFLPTWWPSHKGDCEASSNLRFFGDFPGFPENLARPLPTNRARP